MSLPWIEFTRRCIDENYSGLRWAVHSPRSETGPIDSEPDSQARRMARVSLTTTTTSSLVTLRCELASAGQVALLVSLRPSLWPHPPEGWTEAMWLCHSALTLKIVPTVFQFTMVPEQ